MQLLEAKPAENSSKVRVLSLGQNPTYINRRDEHMILAQGSSTEIEDGDSICLLSTAMGHRFEPLSSPPEEVNISDSSEDELRM